MHPGSAFPALEFEIQETCRCSTLIMDIDKEIVYSHTWRF